MPRLSQEDKVWRINYLYRVWYGAIPGLPNDGVRLAPIGELWNSAFPDHYFAKLGNLYDDQAKLYGYNDIENYLDAETGLLTPERKRIFRLYTEEDSLTEEDWEELEVKSFDDGKTSEFMRIKLTMVFLHTIDNNSLNFYREDSVYMNSPQVSISDVVATKFGEIEPRQSTYRFPNILTLLKNTVLPEPPSLNALPQRKIISERAYQRFMNAYPAYMESYIDNIVGKQE